MKDIFRVKAGGDVTIGCQISVPEVKRNPLIVNLIRTDLIAI